MSEMEERVARAIHALGLPEGAEDDWDQERGIHRAVALEGGSSRCYCGHARTD